MIGTSRGRHDRSARVGRGDEPPGAARRTAPGRRRRVEQRRPHVALERARKAGVPTAAFPLEDVLRSRGAGSAMAAWLDEQGAEVVVLAGYMHLLEPAFLERFPDRIVNVHPAPLPEVSRVHTIEDVLAAGETETAATVHYVDEGVDTGPVIAAERVASSQGHGRDAARARPRGASTGSCRAGARAVRALISTYDKTGPRDFRAWAGGARRRARGERRHRRAARGRRPRR